MYYFNPLDVDDMAAKINDVLTDDVLRTSLMQKSRPHARKYSWERMAQQTLEVYKKALGE